MNNAAPHKPPLAVLVSFSGDGGVERMVVNLVSEFARAGHTVDLLLIKTRSRHLDSLPREINVIKLGSEHTLLNLPALARYLRARRPRAMLVAKHRAIITAVLARRLAGVPTRLAGRLGTNLSGALRGKGALRRWLWHMPMRWFYPRVECLVAVSDGVAADIRAVTGLGEEQVRVIHNPVITRDLPALAEAPLDHPWFRPGAPPVILGAGRFTAQKDFPTLLRAFAEVRRERDCRLVILGKGNLLDDYRALARELGVEQDVDFPGFTPNPYAYMRRAALFVLSSKWEGSPNVLSEALALGTPAVATDCPSGPREVLQDGRYGPLVPVGDHAAMARAMRATLDHPLPREILRQAVARYTVETSARAYLAALGIE